MKNGLLIIASVFFIFCSQKASSQDKIYSETIDGIPLYTSHTQHSYTFKEDFEEKLKAELGVSNYEIEINPDASVTLILIGHHDVNRIIKLITNDALTADSNRYPEEEEAFFNTKNSERIKMERSRPRR